MRLQALIQTKINNTLYEMAMQINNEYVKYTLSFFLQTLSFHSPFIIILLIVHSIFLIKATEQTRHVRNIFQDFLTAKFKEFRGRPKK